MKTISKAEFRDWILRQPDERRVNMRQSSKRLISNMGKPAGDGCGCLMVQYAEEHLGSDGLESIRSIGCSHYAAYLYIIGVRGCETVFKFERIINITDFVPVDLWASISTFGEVKALIKYEN